MNDSQLRRYRRYRDAGLTAWQAWRAVKDEGHTPKWPFLGGLGYGSPVTGEVEGFTVAVEVEYDEDTRIGEDDVTGWFTDKWEEGVIKNTSRGRDRHSCKWYRPSNYDLEYATDEIRKSGVSRGMVAEKLQERLEHAMQDDADREYYGVVAKVSLDGQELSTNSLWGIDVGPDDPSVYLAFVAEECIGEAIYEAQKQIPVAIEATQRHLTVLQAKEDK